MVERTTAAASYQYRSRQSGASPQDAALTGPLETAKPHVPGNSKRNGRPVGGAMLTYIIVAIVAFLFGAIAGAVLMIAILTGETEHIRRGGKK